METLLPAWNAPYSTTLRGADDACVVTGTNHPGLPNDLRGPGTNAQQAGITPVSLPTRIMTDDLGPRPRSGLASHAGQTDTRRPRGASSNILVQQQIKPDRI